MVDLLCDFLGDPAAAAARLRREAGAGVALMGFLIGGLSASMAQLVFGQGFFLGPAGYAMLVCLWHVAMGTLMTALLHLSSELLGGEGRALGLFAMVGLSDLAWALVLPAALIVRALFPGKDGAFSLIMLLGAVSVLWLRARSVSRNYGVSMPRACLAVAAPYAAGALFLAAVLSMAVWGVVRHLLRVFA